MMGFGSPMANGGVNYEQKCKEQADQINKLQQVAQALKSENNALKAAPGSSAQVTEMAKKDETINRIKIEAKKVIDTLKAKHGEELQKLKEEHAAALANARQSNPASSQGPTAHVAALTAELSACKEKISELEVNAEWIEADKQEATSRAEALQQHLASKEADLAALQEQLRALQAVALEHQNAEQNKKEAAAQEQAAEVEALTGRLQQLEEAKRQEEEQHVQRLQEVRQEVQALQMEREARVREAEEQRARADALANADRSENESTRIQLQAQQAQVLELEEQLAQTKAQLEEEQRKMLEQESVSRTATEAAAAAAAAADKAASAEAQLQQAQAASALVQEEKAALHAQVQELSQRRSELEAQVHELNARLEQQERECTTRVEEAAAQAVAAQAAAAQTAAAVETEQEAHARMEEEREAAAKEQQAAEVTAGQTLAQGQNGQNDTQGLVHVAANADLRGNGKDVPEVAELRSKIAELHSTISFLEAELGNAKTDLNKAKTDLNETTVELQQLKISNKELVPELEEKTKSLLEMQSKVEKIKREAHKSKEKDQAMMSDLKQKLEDAEQRAQEAEQRLEQMEAERNEDGARNTQVELEEALRELEEQRRLNNTLQEGNNTLAAVRADLEARLQQEQGVNAQLQTALAEAQRERDNSDQQVRELQTKNKEQKDIMHRVLDKHKEEKESHSKAVAELRQQKQQLEEQLSGMPATEVAEAEAAAQQTLAQALEHAESLEVQLRAKKEEVELLQREIQGLQQLHGEDAGNREASASVGNREPSTEAVQLGNGGGAGNGDDEWGAWNGGDSAAARDSSFANPQPSAQLSSVGNMLPPSSPAAAGPLSAPPQQHSDAAVLHGLGAGHQDGAAMAPWTSVLRSHSHLTTQLEDIQRLAARCAGGNGSSADLASLLSHVEHLRPSLVSQWPSPAGETIEVSSWEELCMWLFAHSPSLESASSPMVFCGLADRRRPLLTTAQEAGETCQHSELAISQAFQRAARGLLPSSATQVELMALGQRHGLPTRMIDFSSSPFAAVHAALLDSPDEDAVVWCVDAAACNQSCNYYAEWVQDVQWFRRRRSAHGQRRRQVPPGERDKALNPEDVEDLVEYCQSRSERGGLGSGGSVVAGVDAEGGRDESAGSNPADALNLQVLGDVVLFMESPSHGPARSVTPGLEEAMYGGLYGSALLGAQGHMVAVMANAYQRMEDWLSRRPNLYRRIVIPARVKTQVRAHLDQAGFTERSLDPGLDGLCAWIKRRYK